MRDVIRQMTQQFRELNGQLATEYTPQLQAVEELRLRMGRIPPEILGAVLGGMTIEVASVAYLNIAREEGLLDEMAASLLKLYDYSMNAFGGPEFFLASSFGCSLKLNG